MTEAERTFAAMHLRARVALAIAFLIVAGVAPELNVMPVEISARLVIRSRGRSCRGVRPGQ